jgi:hypothetical protein
VRPEAARESLARILARWLGSDTALEATADRLWHELRYMDELDAELARWYAYRRLPQGAPDGAPGPLRRVREEVATAHGAPSWTALVSHASEGRLLGAIPISWITDACDLIARTRAASADSPSSNGDVAPGSGGWEGVEPGKEGRLDRVLGD